MSRENIKKLAAFAKEKFSNNKIVGIMETYNHKWFFSLSGFDVKSNTTSSKKLNQVNRALKQYVQILLNNEVKRVFLNGNTITFFKSYNVGGKLLCLSAK